MKRLLVIFFLAMLLSNIGFAKASLRDPILPLTRPSLEQKLQPEKNNDEASLKIQGLFISKSKRVALIEDQFYAVGDMTRQGPLVAIFKDRIVINQGGEMQVIFMSNEKVRQDK